MKNSGLFLICKLEELCHNTVWSKCNYLGGLHHQRKKNEEKVSGGCGRDIHKNVKGKKTDRQTDRTPARRTVLLKRKAEKPLHVRGWGQGCRSKIRRDFSKKTGYLWQFLLFARILVSIPNWVYQSKSTRTPVTYLR